MNWHCRPPYSRRLAKIVPLFSRFRFPDNTKSDSRMCSCSQICSLTSASELPNTRKVVPSRPDTKMFFTEDMGAKWFLRQDDVFYLTKCKLFSRVGCCVVAVSSFRSTSFGAHGCSEEGRGAVSHTEQLTGESSGASCVRIGGLRKERSPSTSFVPVGGRCTNK